jgi:hypothetical protein
VRPYEDLMKHTLPGGQGSHRSGGQAWEPDLLNRKEDF